MKNSDFSEKENLEEREKKSERKARKDREKKIKEIIEAMKTAKTQKEVAKKLSMTDTTLRYYISRYEEVRQAYEEMKERNRAEKSKESIEYGEDEEKRKEYNEKVITSFYKRDIEQETTDTILRNIVKIIKAKSKYDLAVITETGLFVVETYQDTAKALNKDLIELIKEAVDFYLKHHDDIKKFEEMKQATKELLIELKNLYNPELRREEAKKKFEDLIITQMATKGQVDDTILKYYVKLIWGGLYD